MTLSFNDFKNMYGTGETGYDGEWCSTGNYYTYINRPKTNHNYYITFNRSYSKTWKRNGWNFEVRQSLSCFNSVEILIGKGNSKTLKNSKEQVVDLLNNYDKCLEPPLMVNWLNENIHAVFIIEDGKLKIVGNTFKDVTYDFNEKDKEIWGYYKVGIPDYNKYSEVLTLGKFNLGKYEFYISEYKYFGNGCYYGGSISKEKLDSVKMNAESLIERMKEMQEIYLRDKHINAIRKNIKIH
jgi:hypothetical protein